MLKLGVPDPQPKDNAPPVPATMIRGSGLRRYETMCRAIADCHRVDEAKAIHDQAEALQGCARVAKDSEAQQQLAAIRLRAAYRAGTLLIEMAESGARAGQGGDKKSKLPVAILKLKDLGIKPNQAARWQQIAGLPWNDFIAWLAGHQRGEAVPTLSGLSSLAKVHAAAAAAKATGDEAGAPEGGAAQSLEDLAFERPNAFGVIYADPPWCFEVYSGAGKARSAETHYPTMDAAELTEMWPDIQALAAEDCALFLWATMPHLPEALHLIQDWGFEYKTAAFDWLKTNPKTDSSPTLEELEAADVHMGMGYWTRSNSELCLLATRGHPQRLDASVRQTLIAPRGAHSAKPDEARARIERLVGGPYLELFARDETPGWVSWGNEIAAAAKQAAPGDSP